MEDQSDRNEEIVTLFLGKSRIEVNKQKLIDKSRYFAALLSSNYVDSYQSEHIINYEIPLLSLQDFIDWVHNDKLDILTIIYDEDKLERLMTLLELSVLFAVDKLIEDITYTLETCYLLPKHVINIWLLAEELSLNMLRDLCLAICLDRFNELPSYSIRKLPKHNILELVGNINVRASKDDLQHVCEIWMNSHKDLILCSLSNRQPIFLYGLISCQSLDRADSEFYIHYWSNINFNLFEFTVLKYPKDIIDNSIKKMIAGAQITARGYDLYLSGGEFGIGSGKFNTIVWRYSLISKRWIFQTVMLNPRRHMVAVIVENKLLLIGGVGRYRLKLDSVDIYNIYTNTWTQGAKIPIEFTEVPKHYVFNEKIFIYNMTDCIYIYHLDSNIWEIVSVNMMLIMPPLQWQSGLTLSEDRFMPVLSFKTASCCIDVDKKDRMILRSITKICNETRCYYKTFGVTCTKIDLRNYYWYSKNCSYGIELCFITPRHKDVSDVLNKIIVLCVDGYKPEEFYMHTMPILNPDKFNIFIGPYTDTKFFHLTNPANLRLNPFASFEKVENWPQMKN